MLRRTVVTTALGLSCLATLSTPAGGQIADLEALEQNCDSELQRLPPEGLFPYTERPHRCEGSHGVLRSPVDFQLRSVFRSFDDITIDSTGDPITVGWGHAPDAEVSIRIAGVVNGQFYRLDTRTPGGFEGFRWDVEVLEVIAGERRNPPRNALSVLALSATVGDTVYYPVDVAQGNALVPSCGALRMTVWTDTGLDSLWVEVSGSGISEPARRELDGAPYPISEAFDFRVPEITRAGDYRVVLTGRFGVDDDGTPIRLPRTYAVQVPEGYAGPCGP